MGEMAGRARAWNRREVRVPDVSHRILQSPVQKVSVTVRVSV